MYIDEYKIIDIIHSGNNSIVYRGHHKKDGKNYILKVINNEYPDRKEIESLHNEYNFLTRVDYDGIIKCYGFQRYQNTYYLILEDINGITLADYLVRNPLSIESFFHLAIKITDIVSKIHSMNIIHSDINPSNIVINSIPEIVRLIDFSKHLSAADKDRNSRNEIFGTINYIAPEQTGRLNRKIDFRSDLYSLGVTFYQLLTGSLPFTYDDPLEVIHAHIAKVPKKPAYLNSAVPRALSDITMKLIAKNAEDRYQTANGLLYDLRLCFKQFFTDREIEPFTLGKGDHSIWFKISDRVYGRKEELLVLQELYKKVRSGALELALIRGPAGVGKSTLVHELKKKRTGRTGFFIEGKFDLINQNVPYAALSEAIKGLVKQILAEGKEQLAKWRSEILKTVGKTGKVITDVVPEMELIIGKQPEVPRLSASESRNRFKLTILNLLSSFAAENHPIILFLDDLQWADRATLEILNEIVTNSDITYCLVIGTYRPGEDKDTKEGQKVKDSKKQPHKENFLPDHIRDIKAKKSICEIELASLTRENVTSLITETFLLEPGQAAELVNICYEKTSANPFFLKQFLHRLFDERLIWFDYVEKIWCWKIDEARKLVSTDNVVDLLCRKIQKLPPETREILKIASCIGEFFSVDIISALYKKPEVEVMHHLIAAIKENIILMKSGSSVDMYLFLHERLRHTLYSLLSPEEREKNHYQIGRHILSTKNDVSGEDLYDIVNHMDIGKKYIENKAAAANLHLIVGRNSIQAGAYQAARRFLTEGRNLLSGDDESRNYSLNYEINLLLMETYYLTGDFEAMEKIAAVILAHAKDTVDRLKVYNIKIQGYKVQNRYEEGFNEGMNILSKLKVRVPKNPNFIQVLSRFFRTYRQYRKKRVSRILVQPRMRDAVKQEIINICFETAECAGYIQSRSFILLLLHIVDLSLQYGNCDGSAKGYYGLAVLIVMITGNLKEAVAAGRLSLELAENLNDLKSKSSVYLYVSNLISHYQSHLSNIVDDLYMGYQVGLETGQVEYATLSLVSYTYFSFYSGIELGSIKKRLEKAGNTAAHFNQETQQHYVGFLAQAVENFTVEGIPDPGWLTGEKYDARRQIPTLESAGNGGLLLHYYLIAEMNAYLFEEYETALDYSQKGDSYNLPPVMVLFYHLFYQSLILLTLAGSAERREKKTMWRKINTNLKKIKKWSSLGGTNYLDKYYLVLAEKYKYLEKDTEALEYYNLAMSHALKNNFANETALINRQLALFWLKKGNLFLGKTYMKEAYYYYGIWGAKNIQNYLEQNYQNLLFFSLPKESTVSSLSRSSSTELTSFLDINSLMKATQAISKEIEPQKLLYNLIKIVIENAGTQKGVLIIERDGKWIIEAQGIITENEESIQVLHSVPMEEKGINSDFPLLSENIVNYVIRTGENVVLNNPASEGLFMDDEYIVKNQPKSILCMPIKYQSRLNLVLYLENTITAGAFTGKRISILRLLSSQISISIENAMMYKNLNDLNKNLELKVAERTYELNTRNKQILDSINYAQNIQASILPGFDRIDKLLNKYFILYRPRDIVGGDFYDVKEVGENFLITIVDCTGHGVPGALMTMTASSHFNRISDMYADNPARLLKELNIAVKQALNRDSYKLSEDGMEIAVCYCIPGEKKLIYAGARIPLYICSYGKVEVIKGSRYDIGFKKSREDYEYANHEVQLSENQMIYLTTDGFIDQSGGRKQFSFGRKRFKKLLEENYTKSPAEQKRVFARVLDEYQGEEEQLDDITLIGFNLS